jgi:Glycosyl hydrolase family 26
VIRLALAFLLFLCSAVVQAQVGQIPWLVGNGGQIIQASLFGMQTHGVTSPYTPGSEDMPTASVGILGKGSGTVWPYIETARGTFNWTALDGYAAAAAQAGIPVIYTFEYTPGWAIAGSSTATCTTLDGVGLACPALPDSMSDFTTFVTDLVARYCQSGVPSIQYYELYNEPYDTYGTNNAQLSPANLATLTHAAYTIIRANCPAAKIITPSMSTICCTTYYTTYAQSYFTALGPPGTDPADVASVHIYTYNQSVDTPEDLLPGGTLANATTASIISTYAPGKPIWNTEGSWGATGTGLFNTSALEAAFIGRWYLMHLAAGYSSANWYAWDDGTDGTLCTSVSGPCSPRGPAVAYQRTYQWLVGRVFGGCSSASTVYSCVLSGNGYNGLVVWNTAGNSSFTPPSPSSYSWTHPLIGADTAYSGGAVTIGQSPILFDNQGGTLVGAYLDNNCTALSAFAGWLGYSTSQVQTLIYNPGGAYDGNLGQTPPTLAAIEAALAAAQCGNGPTQPQQVSLAITDTSAHILAGNQDAYYVNIATALAADAPTASVALAWEFNGCYYNWGIQSPSCGAPDYYGYTAATFITAWQHIVGVMRAVSGTSGVRFAWMPDACPSCADAQTAWPGAAYVDLVGEDIYQGNPGAGNAVWLADWMNCFRCLGWLVTMGQTYNKPLVLGEFGVGYVSGALDDSDAASMLQQAAQQAGVPLAYLNYWNTDEAYCGVISGEPTGASCPPPGGLTPLSAGPPYQLPQSAITFCTIVGSGIGSCSTPYPGFYVATTGSDSNAGTLAAPFATLGKCQTAMQGSSIKTCYIRAGIYQPAAITSGSNCNFGDGRGSGGTPTVSPGSAVSLTSADSGETWSYYPPDGYNSAIIDGQSTTGQSGDNNNGPVSGAGNGLGCAFGDYQATGITINGLQFERFMWSAFWGLDANNLTFTNNVVHDFTSATFTAYAVAFHCSPTSIATHNYVYNVAYMGIGMLADCNGGSNNNIISYNAILNSCTYPPTANDQNGSDCGAIYQQDTGNSVKSTGMQIIDNYIRDVNTPEASSGTRGGIGIYNDENTENTNVQQNVVAAVNSACFSMNTAVNITITDNICDMDSSPNASGVAIAQFWNTGASSGTTGNTFEHNIVVLSSSSAGFGYNGNAPVTVPLTINDNAYYNYTGASNNVNTGQGGGVNVGTDSNPTFENPLIHCWGAIIGASSPVFNSPVSFPAQPASWDTSGFWGPPGFTMPETGTAPSWPTTSGNGVTCTSSN